ncbi:WhiB family transcriptional regulator [Cellulomonas cellasea]|nr:hypothetical protein CCE01nite_36830 [Cellulomonas cellasea]
MPADRPDTRWMIDAACGRRLDLPWLADSTKVAPDDALTMREVCGHCPVFGHCRDFADRVGASGGFWAGTSYDARTRAHPGLGDVA